MKSVITTEQPPSTTDKIWIQLDPELRRQVISLLAQAAYELVAAEHEFHNNAEEIVETNTTHSDP
jgi:hypothetical protein